MLGNSHKTFFLLVSIATFQPYVTILVVEMNPHSLTWKLFSILGIVGLNNIKANDYLNVVLQVTFYNSYFILSMQENWSEPLHIYNNFTYW